LRPGAEPEALKPIGPGPNEEGTGGLPDKMRTLGNLKEDAPAEDAIEATYRALAEAPSRILLATLDDAVGVPERPNVPGTVREWPNWSLALPQPLEEIETMELPRRLAGVLKRG